MDIGSLKSEQFVLILVRREATYKLNRAALVALAIETNNESELSSTNETNTSQQSIDFQSELETWDNEGGTLTNQQSQLSPNRLYGDRRYFAWGYENKNP